MFSDHEKIMNLSNDVKNIPQKSEKPLFWPSPGSTTYRVSEDNR